MVAAHSILAGRATLSVPSEILCYSSVKLPAYPSGISVEGGTYGVGVALVAYDQVQVTGVVITPAAGHFFAVMAVRAGPGSAEHYRVLQCLHQAEQLLRA